MKVIGQKVLDINECDWAAVLDINESDWAVSGYTTCPSDLVGSGYK